MGAHADAISPAQQARRAELLHARGRPGRLRDCDLEAARPRRGRREDARAGRTPRRRSLEIDITAPRAELVRQRPPLPPGALVLESSPVGAIDTIPIATLRLEGDELRAEAMSEQRLEQTLEMVAADFGELVELRDCEVTSVDEALAERRSGRRQPEPERIDAAELRLVGDFVNERMRRWLDEPHHSLAGRTPREAAAGKGRAEVVRLLRQIENSAERARRCGEPSVDVARLRSELGLGDELAA